MRPIAVRWVLGHLALAEVDCPGRGLFKDLGGKALSLVGPIAERLFGGKAAGTPGIIFVFFDSHGNGCFGRHGWFRIIHKKSPWFILAPTLSWHPATCQSDLWATPYFPSRVRESSCPTCRPLWPEPLICHNQSQEPERSPRPDSFR